MKGRPEARQQMARAVSRLDTLKLAVPCPEDRQQPCTPPDRDMSKRICVVRRTIPRRTHALCAISLRHCSQRGEANTSTFTNNARHLCSHSCGKPSPLLAHEWRRTRQSAWNCATDRRLLRSNMISRMKFSTGMIPIAKTSPRKPQRSVACDGHRSQR